MAVPALPAALNTGDVVSNAWVDAVRDGMEWNRDTRPIFKGEAWTEVISKTTSVLTSTTTTAGFGEAGSFGNTPDINVGGWTVNAADGNPESLVVPEAGIYLVTIHCDWAANTSNRRQSALLVNASAATTSRVRVEAGTSSTTAYSHSVLVDLAASDELDIQLFQDSGSTLTVTPYLTAIWMQST